MSQSVRGKHWSSASECKIMLAFYCAYLAAGFAVHSHAMEFAGALAIGWFTARLTEELRSGLHDDH